MLLPPCNSTAAGALAGAAARADAAACADADEGELFICWARRPALQANIVQKWRFCDMSELMIIIRIL